MSGLAVLAAAMIGSGGVGAVIVKWMSRSVDGADADERRARARKDEVETLREIIAEVRASEAKKDARLEVVEVRLDRLEERERHMLTRAAVHEAWDQIAFQMLLAQNPHYPAPPPLTIQDAPEPPTESD